MQDFNPHHPRGWRLEKGVLLCCQYIFQSTPPSRVATPVCTVARISRATFQSTPPSRVATPDAKTSEANRQFQSTPPSRVATNHHQRQNGCPQHFNPHHPRGWRRNSGLIAIRRVQFQSTPPSRVATIHGNRHPDQNRNFNPHHPRGWRPWELKKNIDTDPISIHTTLAGGDDIEKLIDRLSTISIHTTLAGGDLSQMHLTHKDLEFQSTPPSRVATQDWMGGVLTIQISIHTTLAGGDHTIPYAGAQIDISIHTTLAGGDLGYMSTLFVLPTISIHTTLAGGDDNLGQFARDIGISIHTTLAGGDCPTFSSPIVTYIISIHTTLAGGDKAGCL